LRCFASVFQYFHKTPEKHWKTQKNSQLLEYCGSFPRAKKFDCIAQNAFHKTSAKHRKTPQKLQNTAKQSQNAFCEITSQNTAKRTQNARKRRKKRSQYSRNTYCAHSVFSPKMR